MALYYRICMIFFIALVGAFAHASNVNDSDKLANTPANLKNLVILQYHHVSNDTPASTSISPDMFRQHMQLLADNYHVIDLSLALEKLKSHQQLPDKSVAITFDDGYANIKDNAHPILKEFNFPYTIFVNPAIIGESKSQLSWQQIKGMQTLATFANHTLDHAHLLEKYGNENDEQWLTRVLRDVALAEEILSKEIGYSKKWLAYPYGEYNIKLKTALAEKGYVGFGQQSGSVSHFSDFSALPRFPAAGIYANLDSLKVKLNSLAMPLKSVSPERVAYIADDSLNELTLNIHHPDVNLAQFACYFKGEKLKFLGVDNTITVKVKHLMQPGRTRINCTAPSKILSGRYYWYSHPFFVATHEGEFFD